MRGLLKTGAVALMLTCIGGNVVAQTAGLARCATAEDMFAIRAAAVQQRLMVAALSCRATNLYQQFVGNYRKSLIDSDTALQNFFLRLNAQTGTADFHAFKTHLANAAAIQPSRDALKFCADAKVTFAAASKTNDLKVFLAHQTTAEDNAFPRCGVLTASTNAVPRRR